MLKLAADGFGDGEAAGSGGDCVETGGTCPFSQGWPLLSSSQLLTVWKYRRNVADASFFVFFSPSKKDRKSDCLWEIS